MLAVAVLVVLALGVAELSRRAAPPAQTVVAVPEPTVAPTTQPAQTPAPTQPSATVPVTSTTTAAPVSPPSPEPSAVDCYAVRDAGGGPIRRGERGYAAHLDDDGDGLACEYLPRR